MFQIDESETLEIKRGGKESGIHWLMPLVFIEDFQQILKDHKTPARKKAFMDYLLALYTDSNKDNT